MKHILHRSLRNGSDPSIQLGGLGLHERMKPVIVNRPSGFSGCLIMLFHSEAAVKTREGVEEWPPSSLMIWPPYHEQYYGNTSISWLHSWFICDGRFISQMLKKHRIPVMCRIAISDPSLMDMLLLELVEEQNAWKEPNATIVKNLLENFFIHLKRQILLKDQPQIPPYLLAVRSFIDEYFTEHLRLADLARDAHCSRAYLCSEFKRFFGVPIMHYAFQLRMNHAAFLLQDHNRRISEISEAVGYSDPFTFSKMFRRHFSVSPRTFREANDKSRTGKQGGTKKFASPGL
jgi:AraC-like DNA-binding protein